MDSPTSETGCKNVYLLITPLQCYYKYQLNKLDFAAARNENRRVPFRRLQHWAIQVGDELDGVVYEVTSYWEADRKPQLRIHSAKDWRNGRCHPPRRKLFITVTGWSVADLDREADQIWDTILEEKYRGLSRNCQSFAELFKAVIENKELLTEEASTQIDHLPSSFNPFYAVLHLKQAKATALRLGKAFKRKRPTSGSPTDEHNDKRRRARLPIIRSSGWLQHLNEASNQRDWEQDNFRKVAENATHSHRTKRLAPKR